MKARQSAHAMPPVETMPHGLKNFCGRLDNPNELNIFVQVFTEKHNYRIFKDFSLPEVIDANLRV